MVSCSIMNQTKILICWAGWHIVQIWYPGQIHMLLLEHFCHEYSGDDFKSSHFMCKENLGANNVTSDKMQIHLVNISNIMPAWPCSYQSLMEQAICSNYFRLVQDSQGRMEDGMEIQSNLANRTNKVKFSTNEPRPTVQGEIKEKFHFVMPKSQWRNACENTGGKLLKPEILTSQLLSFIQLLATIL